MNAKEDIHKKDLPYDANENLSVSISSSEVIFHGIKNEVFISEDEESESFSKKRKRTSKMEKKEEKEKEKEDRRKQCEVARRRIQANA